MKTLTVKGPNGTRMNLAPLKNGDFVVTVEDSALFDGNGGQIAKRLSRAKLFSALARARRLLERIEKFAQRVPAKRRRRRSLAHREKELLQ